MSCGGGYPLGAEYDPRAPWNEKEPVMVKCEACDGKGKHWYAYESLRTEKRNARRLHGISCRRRKNWRKRQETVT